MNSCTDIHMCAAVPDTLRDTIHNDGQTAAMLAQMMQQHDCDAVHLRQGTAMRMHHEHRQLVLTVADSITTGVCLRRHLMHLYCQDPAVVQALLDASAAPLP